MQNENDIVHDYKNVKIDVYRTERKTIEKMVARIRKLFRYLGPAFIVSVAYIDPGNLATNISGGSTYNYDLIWVILWSNILAIFLQYNSAKLGIATGFNLPEICSIVFSRRVNIILWIAAELASMATTIAEFIGAALGFYLLFNIPLPVAGLVTSIVTFAITYLQKYGQRTIEATIIFFVGIICIAYSLEIFLAKPNWAEIGKHMLIPSLPDSNALLIAVGMFGATVMPHVIYLHSQLVQERNIGLNTEQKKQHLAMEKTDIIIAMNIAFIVNAAIVVVSAAVFYKEGMILNSIEQAHRSLEPLLGPISSSAFAIALLASGFSSSAVGTMAGETVMDGFINIKFPSMMKRLITMIPAMIIILAGLNPMKSLVLSQVLLSFTLPFAIIPMLIITNRRDLMGDFVNSPLSKVIGWIIASVTIAFNSLLLIITFVGKI